MKTQRQAEQEGDHFRVVGLDLTSLGSPQNTEVGVYATTWSRASRSR